MRPEQVLWFQAASDSPAAQGGVSSGWGDGGVMVGSGANLRFSLPHSGSVVLLRSSAAY